MTDLRMKIIKILGVIVILLLVFGYFMFKQVKRLQDERNTYRSNYTSQVQATILQKLKDGREIASVNQILLTKKEALRSSDSMVQKLNKDLKDIGHKLKNVEYAFSVYISAHGGGTTGIDTIYVDRNNDTIIEFKPFSDNLVDIYNTLYNIDSLHTKYILKDIRISGDICKYKEGKWKPINIISWRPKWYKLTLIPADTNVHFSYAKLIKYK